MYHQYMYGSFSPVTQASDQFKGHSAPREEQSSQAKQADPFGNIKSSLSGLLGKWGPKDLLLRFDTGDILLFLIILLLFLEGDNLELVITLGLMLLFSLDDGHSTL